MKPASCNAEAVFKPRLSRFACIKIGALNEWELRFVGKSERDELSLSQEFAAFEYVLCGRLKGIDIHYDGNGILREF